MAPLWADAGQPGHDVHGTLVVGGLRVQQLPGVD
jgi:hypothetical protein